MKSLTAVAQLPSPSSTVHDPCKFPGVLPEDVRVFAAGGYGAASIRHLTAPTSSSAASEFEILVHQPGSPIVLMLGAYESSVFRLKWSEQTNIVGVYLSGYNKQIVVGAPAGIPQLHSFASQGGKCPYFYVTQEELPKLNPVARFALGRPITRVYLAETRQIHIGAAPPGTKFVSNASVVITSGKELNPVIAGRAGLEVAVESGSIRRATWSDVDAWFEAAERMSPPRPRHAPGKIITTPLPGTAGPRDTYVVLRPFKYPPDLYGSDASTFYVPRGVPAPTGDPGHSTVLNFNKLRCPSAADCP